MDGFQHLALAIVVQAIKDYKKAQQILKRHPENDRAKKEIKDIDQFLHSDWYESLTSIKCEMILRLLHER